MNAKGGGAKRDRTADLKLAKLALSQLSYGPVVVGYEDQMVGPERVERSTSRLSGVRSNHLSYEPDEVQHLLAREALPRATCPRAVARARRKGRETRTAARRRLSSDDVWDGLVRVESSSVSENIDP
jgi:hypothetical protein